MRQNRIDCRAVPLLVIALTCLLPGCSCVPRREVTQSSSASPRTEQANEPKANRSPTANSSSSSDSAEKSKGSQSQSPAPTLPASADRSPGNAKGSTGSRTGIAGVAGGAPTDEASADGQGSVSPVEASKQGTRLYDAAIDRERQGDAAEAFAKALRGWQLVRSHPNDPECARLERQFLPLVERLGEAANASFQGGSPIRTIGKPTVIE